MEYYGNRLCVSAEELVDAGIMTYANYKAMASRGRIEVMRRGGGYGRTALVAVDSLPSKFLDKYIERFHGATTSELRHWVLSNYKFDKAALVYFVDWAAEEHSGKTMGDIVSRYTTNASVLNTCIMLHRRNSDYKKLMGEKFDWDMMAKTVRSLRDELGHTLPSSTLRFRKKVNEYKREGYKCLISGKFGNQNSKIKP